MNGYLYLATDGVDDYKNLAEIINKIDPINMNKIRSAAVESVRAFSWNNIIDKIEKLINDNKCFMIKN